MSKFKFGSLLLIFILSMTSFVVSAQDSDSNVAITLERTACFGACPVYTLTIYDDGTVVYNGGNFVEVTGEQTFEIAPETVTMLVDGFVDAGYFEWDEAYNSQTITDMPSTITSVTHDGETHQIVRYGGDFSAPLALSFLEQWVDLTVNTQLWTGVQPDPASISNGTDSPVITLFREPCYGMCPVYSVALYADGTVVFTGIANVAELGVTIIETEAFMAENIAQMAEIFGYFDWNERYDTQFMTDQATVITSIRSDTAYNRIVRYDGDPTAPIGLLWIEERIGQLVTDLID